VERPFRRLAWRCRVWDAAWSKRESKPQTPELEGGKSKGFTAQRMILLLINMTKGYFVSIPLFTWMPRQYSALKAINSNSPPSNAVHMSVPSVLFSLSATQETSGHWGLGR
jgi:hypothetical protein